MILIICARNRVGKWNQEGGVSHPSKGWMKLGNLFSYAPSQAYENVFFLKTVHLDFIKFSQKTAWNQDKFGHRGASGAPPRSATEGSMSLVICRGYIRLPKGGSSFDHFCDQWFCGKKDVKPKFLNLSSFEVQFESVGNGFGDLNWYQRSS